MLDSQWYLGVWLAVTAAHLVVLYGLYRRQRATGNADTEAVQIDDGTIECPDCGAANDADYRYCGGCATQLPHAMPLDRQESGPMGSLLR